MIFIYIKRYNISNTTLVFNILLFLKNNLLKRKKPFSKSAKGLEIVSSPYWTRSELLREILQLKILD